MRSDKAKDLYRIGAVIQEFTGQNPRGSASKVKKYRIGLRKQKYLARLFFYKYGMDKGISYKDLQSFTGDRNFCNAYRLRKAFIKRVNNSPDKKDLYNRFKRYLEDIEAT